MKRPCLCLQSNDDGTMTVLYFGRTIGWISKIKAYGERGRRYRALSIHGDVAARGSLSSARAFIVERAA